MSIYWFLRYPSVINSAVIEANAVLVCAHKTDVRLNQNWNVCGRKISYEWPKDRTISCMTGCHHYVWKRSLKKSQSRRMISVFVLVRADWYLKLGFPLLLQPSQLCPFMSPIYLLMHALSELICNTASIFIFSHFQELYVIGPLSRITQAVVNQFERRFYQI